MRRQEYDAAAQMYQALIAKSPKSVSARLGRADALKGARQWDEALVEYRRVLDLSPGNIEALTSMAAIERWRGNLPEAERLYKRAAERAPTSPAPVLGLAATYALDHDFAAAQAQYDRAATRWPKDEGVRQAAYDFARERNPRLFVFYEDDLSFTTKQVGAFVPFASRHEVGVEAQDEERPNLYTRRDKKFYYTYHFGLNHSLDFFYRDAKYDYDSAVTDFVAIDSYVEYRLRYVFPVTLAHAIGVRYSGRPTTLKTTQDEFTAHKLEAEVRSSWSPKFKTVIGSGWLRDLDSSATSTSDTTENSLARFEFQYYLSDRSDVSGKYITNPDLDATVNAMTILEASYSLDGGFSGLARVRYDDYKTGDDQTAYYLGLRFVPNSHFWSEIGAKYVERGSESGTYPLVSLVFRF